MSHVEARLHAPSLRQQHVSVGVFVACLEFFDLAVIAGAGAVANWLRFDTWSLAGSHSLMVILVVLIAYFVFKHTKLHEHSALPNWLAQVRRAATAMLLLTFVILAVSYATKTSEAISRLWLGMWLAGAFLALALTRPVVTRLYRRLEIAGAFSRHFVVFSTVSELEPLQAFLDRWTAIMPPSDIIVGVFLDRPEQAAEKGFRSQYLVKGAIDDFLKWSGSQRVDNAVAVMSPQNSQAIEPLLQTLRCVSLDLSLVAGQVDEIWAQREVGKIAGLPVIHIMARPLDSAQIVLKRLEDVVVAGTALIFFGPLMLLVALAVKLDGPGPVFFRQARHGFNNRPFQVFKFRTMRHTQEVMSDLTQARRHDPRVTRVGALLRKTSLDELPQLFNVLSGDMSIVGPRPHAVEHNDKYAQQIDAYMTRHRIKPGITGWAQVNGWRGETDTLEKMRKRVEYDLFYVDNWSPKFDLKIMIMTLSCFVDRNAY
jgi:putative colanic acid biosynthesis UDP-glucose lipid carrier transferase